MSIRAVIFDLGGVLVRTKDPAPRARLAARLGMSPAELSRIIFDEESARQATLGAITTQDHWETVRRKLGLSPDDFPENVAGARAVGLHAVHFRDSLQARTDLEAVLDGR